MKRGSAQDLPGGPVVKNCQLMQCTQVQSLVWEDLSPYIETAEARAPWSLCTTTKSRLWSL